MLKANRPQQKKSMYLTSIRGLNDMVKETDLFKSTKRPSAKDVLIDRTNFIIHSIAEGNRHHWNVADFEAVPLYKGILKEQLGNSYTDITNCLLNLGIINIDHSYIPTSTAKRLTKSNLAKGIDKVVKPISKKYGLTKKAKSIGLSKVGVLSHKTETRIRRHKSNILDTYLKDEIVHAKIIFNTTDLCINLEDITPYLNNLDTQEQKDHFISSYNTLKKFNTFTTIDQYKKADEYFYQARNKVGRCFNYFTTVPKSLRINLIHRTGEQLSEIDLVNSQPLLLGLTFSEIDEKVFGTHININRKGIQEEGIFSEVYRSLGIGSILDSSICVPKKS